MNEERITKIIYLSTIVSILLHLALGVALVKGAARERKKETIISFDIVKVKEEKRERPPPPERPSEKQRQSLNAPKPKRVIDLTKKKKVKIVKPEDIEEQKEEPPKAPENPQNFGIDSSLVDTSGKSSVAMAVPIGETMIGDPSLKRGSSNRFIKGEDKIATTAPIEAISSMPKVIREVKPKYPEEARRLGIEGSVVLLLEIDENGRVVSARPLKPRGYGLDEEAIKAAYKLRFAPAMAGKVPIRVKIKYTFTFLLED